MCSWLQSRRHDETEHRLGFIHSPPDFLDNSIRELIANEKLARRRISTINTMNPFFFAVDLSFSLWKVGEIVR